MKQTKASILYFMGPAMLLFCLIFIYPVSRTAIMSFFSVKSVTSAVSTWSWAGLDNYIKLFHTPLFITSVINIGKIWLYCGIACLGLAIVLAIILTSGLRGQKFFRAIIYMPNVIAAVAVGYMWLLYVYNAKFGLFHSFFTAIGWKSMANFQWLGTDHMFLSMCIAYVFSNVGYFMLMYIAATRNRRNCDDNNGHNAGRCCCNTRVHAVCTNLTAEQGLVGIHHRSIGAYTAENLCQSEEAHRFGSPQHQRSAKNALNQREGDVEEFVKNICTLNSGGFIVIGRDFFNKSIKDDGYEL